MKDRIDKGKDLDDDPIEKDIFDKFLKYQTPKKSQKKLKKEETPSINMLASG